MPLAKITVTILDAKGAKGFHGFWVDYPEFPADQNQSPIDYAHAYAQLLDPLIDGQIVNVNVSTNVTLPTGMKATPVLTSDIEDGLRATFQTETYSTVQMTIPTFSEDFVATTGELIIEGQDILDWLTIIEAPTESPGDYVVFPGSERGEAITNLIHAAQKFKGSKNRA